MSTQRGNVHRQRPQRHKNSHQFDPVKHSSKKKEKELVELQPMGLCQHCYDVVCWRIKYKKYKQITQPSKCVKCDQRNVKRSYYVLCDDCIVQSKACGKCLKSTEVVVPITEKEDAAVQREIQAQIDSLPERKRRTFYRYVEREQNGGANECDCCDHDDKHEQCEHSHSHSKLGNGKASQLLEKLKLNDDKSEKRRHGTSSCDEDEDSDDEDCSDDDEDEDVSDEQ